MWSMAASASLLRPGALCSGQRVAYTTPRHNLLNDQQAHACFVRECLLWKGKRSHPNIAEAHTALAMDGAI